MKPKKTITILTLILILLVMVYSIRATPIIGEGDRTYLGGLVWYNTYAEGARVASEKDKPIMTYFWAIWCQICAKLHREVFPDAEVSKTLKEDFILVAVDLDANKEDANRFDVLYPPHFIFSTPEGEIITRIPGYASAEDLLMVLQEISSRYGGD